VANINSRFGADGSDDRVLRVEPKLDALIRPEGNSGGACDGEVEDSEPDSTVLVANEVANDDASTVLEDAKVSADPDVDSALLGGVDVHAAEDRVDGTVLDAVLAGAVQAAQDEAVRDEVVGEFLDEHYSSDDVDMRRSRQLALYRAARADGFSGPRWDALAIELMRYGLAAMEAWLTTGLILKKVAHLGRPVTLRDRDCRWRCIRAANAPAPAVPQVAADAPKVVWALDFQFDSTIDGKAIKIASMLDEHTRESLLQLVERSITAERLIAELDTVFAAAGGPPTVLRMGKGPELISHALHQFCAGKVGLSYIRE
jgi:hypothetical protein